MYRNEQAFPLKREYQLFFRFLLLYNVSPRAESLVARGRLIDERLKSNV